MNDPMLQLEMRLLLVRHGRRKVVEALAAVDDSTMDEIEKEVVAAENRKAKSRSTKITDPERLIVDAFQARPELVPVIKKLASEYENRTFLPQLRHVQRFLDQHGGSGTRQKSRRNALGAVIKSLASMDPEEVRQLVAATSQPGDSDYALLAREIMGGAARKKAT